MSDEYVAPLGPSTRSSLDHEFFYIYACLRKGIFGDNPHVKYLRLFTERHIWRQPSRNDVDSSPKTTLETTLETAKPRNNVQKESLGPR